MLHKYFSVSEANELLPSIRFDLEALQGIKRKLDTKFMSLQMLRVRASDLPEDGEQDPFFALECEIEFLQLESRMHMSNIESRGAELKDIDIGLIDFPAMIGGQEVLLCWRLGEERVAYYHSRADGFMGRKPIADEVE